jgi:acyl-CoA thioesterase-1
VILAGMEAPPNLGPDYTRAFRAVYADLAREYDVPFVPFLLEGVAGVSSLNQRDGIHPNAEGAGLIAELVWPVLEPIAEERYGNASAAP